MSEPALQSILIGDGLIGDNLVGDGLVGDGSGEDNFLLSFQVDGLDVRGRTLRLGQQIDQLLKRHAYPKPVLRLLAEAATLTVLLGSALKLSGRFQLQTKSDGPVSMLVVDFEAPNAMRAYAHFDNESLKEGLSSSELLGKGHLALTIDQGGNMNRYQGVVELDGSGLEVAAHQYFKQSEQIPTQIRIAVGEITVPGGKTWRSGGLFLQFLPAAPERMRQADLPPGDLPARDLPARDLPAGDSPEPAPPEAYGFNEDDAWTETKLLAGTVEDHELLDPMLSSEKLLYRLFHERGVRLFEGQAIVENCRCSSERIMGMLQRFSPQERHDMIGDNGMIGITCEFCSTHYSVTPEQLKNLTDDMP